MTDQEPPCPPEDSPQKVPQGKQKRNIQKPYDKLSQLLRENLLKRKQQQRGRIIPPRDLCQPQDLHHPSQGQETCGNEPRQHIIRHDEAGLAKE